MNTCKDCKFWNQPEWIFSLYKRTPREKNVTGFCTWHPDFDKLPYYLQFYYGIEQNKEWNGVVQNRDSFACPVFEERERKDL